MAVLTNADYREMRDYLYRLGSGKEELKAQAALRNETQLKAGMQALEDIWTTTHRAAAKSALDTALGFTTGAALAKFFFEAWFQNRKARGL